MTIVRLGISSALGLLLIAQSAVAFDNSFLSGCHATSLFGNILGPQFAVSADGQLVPDPENLVLHGTAAVGVVCFGGNGEVTDLTITQNIAGLCVIPLILSSDTTGTGTYTVNEDGTGSATVQTTISFDADLPAGCALLGAQAGDQATFGFSFVLSGRGCTKVMGANLVTRQGPIPFVTEGDSCPQ